LLANGPRNTPGYGVRNLTGNTLPDLDGLLCANRLANRVADRPGASLGNHAANLVAAGTSLGDHLANLVAASASLGNHAAHFVAASFGTSLGNHPANLVAASTGLGNHPADLVATRLRALFTHVLRAADLLRVALGNPNLLAALPRWALDAHLVATARCVAAAATTSVVSPGAGRANDLGPNWARNFRHDRIPMATVHRNRLGVLDRLTNRVANLSGFGFPNRLADRVVACLGFPNRLAHGVANVASLGFPNRLAHGVVPRASFPNGLADRVSARLGFPNRLAHGVANVASFGFPNRLAHGVATRFGFPNWLAHGVTNFLGALLPHVLRAVHNTVFTDTIPTSFVTSDLLLLIFSTSHGLHHRVALHLATGGTTIVTSRSAITCVCLCWGENKHHSCDQRRSHPSFHFLRLLKIESWVSTKGWSWDSETCPSVLTSDHANHAP